MLPEIEEDRIEAKEAFGTVVHVPSVEEKKAKIVHSSIFSKPKNVKPVNNMGDFARKKIMAMCAPKSKILDIGILIKPKSQQPEMQKTSLVCAYSSESD